MASLVPKQAPGEALPQRRQEERSKAGVEDIQFPVPSESVRIRKEDAQWRHTLKPPPISGFDPSPETVQRFRDIAPSKFESLRGGSPLERLREARMRQPIGENADEMRARFAAIAAAGAAAGGRGLRQSASLFPDQASRDAALLHIVNESQQLAANVDLNSGKLGAIRRNGQTAVTNWIRDIHDIARIGPVDPKLLSHAIGAVAKTSKFLSTFD